MSLCEVLKVGEKYSVTWNKRMNGLNVFSPKVKLLFEMIVTDAKSNEIGIVLSDNNVLWVSSLIFTTGIDELVDVVRRTGNVYNESQIQGAIFDNTDDVELFTNRLEQKYIWHVLKN